LKAGAELCDLEFTQFFPTALVWPPELAGLIWVGELRYHCGAWLMNKYSERFMARYDPVGMELATRDLVAHAIAAEILEGRGTPHGGVWMSIAHLARNQVQAFLDETFPGDVFGGHNLREAGIDVRSDALEVAPIAHFHMGGIRIDARTSAGVGGLFAAGEVTAGLHGANRIENNALSESQVFGAIAGEQAARYALRLGSISVMPNDHTRLRRWSRAAAVPPNQRVAHIRTKIQRIMWERVGLIRDRAGLEQAVTDLTHLNAEARAWPLGGSLHDMLERREVQNLALVTKAMAQAAHARTESRGAHVRTDYPEQNNAAWLQNLIVTLDSDELRLRTEPVQFSYVPPPDAQPESAD
jgi:fumarate reductase (CoM/CoB) subunit A